MGTTNNVNITISNATRPDLIRPSPGVRLKQDSPDRANPIAIADNNKTDKISEDAYNQVRLREQVKKELDGINKQLDSMNYSIRFAIDDKLKDLVVKIVDKDTDKVIRQIPPEDVLKLRARMQDMLGLILEDKA
ncbi:MAG: flagellar protein FlaG [Deltaproteobacteria bacterium]|nr:flagellar protein FlaG [Deltaproteobacteria bacterium]